MSEDYIVLSMDFQMIANRIFETLLYDYFLTAGDSLHNEIFRAAAGAIHSGNVSTKSVCDNCGILFS